MHQILVMASALAMLTAAESAIAAPLSYDCDTPEGSYSELAQIQSGPAFHVRGTITPLQVRMHERYAPSAQVRLESRDESQGIAVQVVSMRRDNNFEVFVTLGTGPSATRDRTPVGPARMNEAVPFDLSVSAAGNAIVTVAGQRREFRVNLGRDARLSVICSTGEFEFGDLELGR